MSDLIIIEDPSNYPVPDEGLHSAVLVDAVNLGTLETPWGPKEKVSLIFELQSTDENGKHFIVGKRFTRSLNDKAALRQFLQKWRGIKYTPAELQQGIDLENLIGMSSTLFVVLNEKEERTYANIESVLPYKNKHGDIDHFALQPSGEYTRVIERPDYKEPEEYAEAVNGQHD